MLCYSLKSLDKLNAAEESKQLALKGSAFTAARANLSLSLLILVEE
jgi:hypothetical protein